MIIPLNAQENKSKINLYIQNRDEALKLISQTAGTLERDYHNWCGTYVHDLMWKCGIIPYDSGAYDGKSWYTAYKEGNKYIKLNDGWTYTVYDGEAGFDKLIKKYNGRVYNIVVSMESGSQFGHALFINAIIDGKVYFTESYDSANLGAAQKGLIEVDLEYFKDYFFHRSYFSIKNRGVIHFYEEDFYKPIITFDDKKPVDIETVYEHIIKPEQDDSWIETPIRLENMPDDPLSVYERFKKVISKLYT
jgi:hypothetical protein